MKFTDTFHDELKTYLGNVDDFLLAQKISVSRDFTLLNHQDNVLDTIEKDRVSGKSAFLVVLPTGTGKTEILIADYAREFKAGCAYKFLLMVPSRQLKIDHIRKIINRLNDYSLPPSLHIGDSLYDDIVIQTYSWLSRHYHEIKTGYFDYIAIDEAHHAMAPTVRRVIQHFNPKTLIGMTATDKRLDAVKLEEVFGSYNTDLSLVDAISEGILAPIKAFRLRSNLDLSEIRYNGKDYYSKDLQKLVVVPSRDQLVVDTLLKYFVDSPLERKQGLVFCVSIKHAQSMAELMRKHKISAKAVSGKDSKSHAYIEDYQKGKIQFLTTCSLLNEGWDSPQTSIIVMARPTMSQVLYTQQIGRGTRKHPGKEALYLIDMVDNYGAGGFNKSPWSIHALLGIPEYMPWGNILKRKETYDHEELILAGLYEYERSLEKINIFTFEREYPDHIGVEQLARELFISTGTVNSWIRKEKITPAISIPVGKRGIFYFSPDQLDDIRIAMGLKKHDESTQYDDFYEFMEKGDYTFSFKIVMILNMLKIVDHNGECELDELVKMYTEFYRDRLSISVAADKENCPYNDIEYLNNHNQMKRSLLANPFEKFERKRFMYHCKDLGHISFSPSLWTKINNNEDLNRIKTHYFKDLIDYYELLGGLPNETDLLKTWNVR